MKNIISKIMIAGIVLLGSVTSKAFALTVAISLVDLSNPFFIMLAEEISAQLEAQVEGQLTIYVHSSAYDLNQQNQQIKDFINKEVDIIFISASASDAIEPSIISAREKGIIVAAVDIESRGADISITSDNFQAGQLSCQYLVDRLGGKGEIAIINGWTTISSTSNRVAGCRDLLKKYPGIKLVSYSHNGSGSFSGGLESMTYLMLEYPNLEAVFAINDLAALGAEEAAKQSGNNKIIIASVDGSPLFLEHLKLKDSLLVATAAQFPRAIAQKAVILALQKLRETSAGHTTELIPTELVTKQNVSQFSNWDKTK
ncbi:monosaccharide ABC transporter substrate-binding protein, CUT2 family [Psychromonas ingrahamii 37]|uniref:Monosaccharide ABC transporter substrate-binding protein, CUT2 family n=1 Tax=Psychromonas ingrahamii (strain DSM 17664 / CCUG 51855 / 37) TaxID=357804 RepID=A1SYE6_PSYIN|nr:substrate-binding domain-containing protein [Psychromonas ingrahamii]ABM04511.1 monosaccharide ABC transporter substrate-binding protein, CUT2 family [Psychromonas ingrahamii 37]